jgi:hypothetical protein
MDEWFTTHFTGIKTDVLVYVEVRFLINILFNLFRVDRKSVVF